VIIVEVRRERFLVKEVNENKFSVISLNSTAGSPRQYCVQFNDYRWICNCPHFRKNGDDPNFVCKHILAVMSVQAKTVVLKRNVKTIEEQAVFG